MTLVDALRETIRRLHDSPHTEDPASGRAVLHRLHESAVQKAVHEAALAAGPRERATCHPLRPGFAPHLREAGAGLRTIQTLPGHADVRTTIVYTHVVDRGAMGVISPLDR